MSWYNTWSGHKSRPFADDIFASPNLCNWLNRHFSLSISISATCRVVAWCVMLLLTILPMSTPDNDERNEVEINFRSDRRVGLQLSLTSSRLNRVWYLSSFLSSLHSRIICLATISTDALTFSSSSSTNQSRLDALLRKTNKLTTLLRDRASRSSHNCWFNFVVSSLCDSRQ